MLEALVYRSNLLGADRALANQGGGNTSSKGTTVDHAGREQRVLWVKGSGTDLASITEAGFPALAARRDPAAARTRVHGRRDDGRVPPPQRARRRISRGRRSRRSCTRSSRRAHVDHTHPDAIIALTSSPDGRRLAEEAFGDEAVWLDYQRPGFDMSKRIAELLDANPSARAVLLEKHGLVTWGETPEESYRATIEFVTRAARRSTAPRTAGSASAAPRSRSSGRAMPKALLARALPALRGALLADADGVVLEVDRSPEAVAFASSVRAPEVSQIGAPCPDHLINTKHKPLAVAFDPGYRRRRCARRRVPARRRRVRRVVPRATTSGTSTRRRGSSRSTRPGRGSCSSPASASSRAGRDAAKARTARDLYHRAIAVQDAADAVGGFRSLSESEAFAIEYWPLERYKLAQAPPRGELAGRVALITGGASGIGRATARMLAARGAHVVVADRNVEGVEEVAEELTAAHGARRALAVFVDVTSEDAVVEMTRRTVLEYGGIDILVASAGLATSAPITETTLADWEQNYAVLARGYFLAARETFRVLLEQGRGGSVVFVASKNALVAGANAAAYSSAKAASLHLARCLAEEGGPHRIRVNTVNPDAVIQGSSIWSSDWKAERASTYGVSEDELQTFYQGRTKLGVAVLPEDVAEAIAFFAGPRSAKSTGNILNVDGGVTAAYPR